MSTKSKSLEKQIDLTEAVLSGKPNLTKTLVSLQALRTAKGKSDKEIHALLDQAYNELKQHDLVLMLERLMLHIGDVSRQHNILTKLGIKSEKGGAQEREIFRSILRWWALNIPDSFYKNLDVITEFTVFENIMFYQNTTDRFKGNKTKTEVFMPLSDKVFEFLSSKIKSGVNTNLLAKHLPNYVTGKSRTKKILFKEKKGVKTFNFEVPKNKEWVKLNGEIVKGKSISVKAGDIVSYPRKKQGFTLEKQKQINHWISKFCDYMGWSLEQYKNFRSKQDTSEQKFASKSVLDLPKSDFWLMLDNLTSGQRFRVAKSIAFKGTDGKLQPKEKWGNLGKWYIEWENNQEKVAQKIREASASGDDSVKKELMKEFKVKSTGLQSVDLLAELFKGGLTNTQIDNTYQSLLEKMDLIARVFPIIDGSGSMGNTLDIKGVRIKYFDIVATFAIAFSTRNPVPEFRNTFGWFSSNFKIVGNSKFIDERPNRFLDKKDYTKEVPTYQVLSETKSFTENLNAIRKSNPGEVASTNMFASIEYFVKLVQDGKYHVEDLPEALLYLTDNESNTGKSPAEAQRLANSIGWNPLLIFWGVSQISSHIEQQLKGLPNALYVGGFNESVLSQVLRGIKSGSINPQEELWSIFEDKRYSVIS